MLGTNFIMGRNEIHSWKYIFGFPLKFYLFVNVLHWLLKHLLFGVGMLTKIQILTLFFGWKNDVEKARFFQLSFLINSRRRFDIVLPAVMLE